MLLFWPEGGRAGGLRRGSPWGALEEVPAAPAVTSFRVLLRDPRQSDALLTLDFAGRARSEGEALMLGPGVGITGRSGGGEPFSEMA